MQSATVTIKPILIDEEACEKLVDKNTKFGKAQCFVYQNAGKDNAGNLVDSAVFLSSFPIRREEHAAIRTLKIICDVRIRLHLHKGGKPRIPASEFDDRALRAGSRAQAPIPCIPARRFQNNSAAISRATRFRPSLWWAILRVNRPQRRRGGSSRWRRISQRANCLRESRSLRRRLRPITGISR